MPFQDKRGTAIGNWVLGNLTNNTQLHQEVKQLFRNKGYMAEEKAISDLVDFEKFRAVVQWKTAQPKLDKVTADLKTRLASLIPELDTELAAEAVIAHVATAAAATDVQSQTLTRLSLWKFLNNTTLAGLTANPLGQTGRTLIFGRASVPGAWATCGLVVRTERAQRLESYSSFWAKSPSAEAVARLGNKLEFSCYLAVSDRAARHSRSSVRKQLRYSEPNLETGKAITSAIEFANDLARRSLEYSNGNTGALASMLTKVRWLKLPSGHVLTAKDLLTVRRPA